jgi:hypothetical protein
MMPLNRIMVNGSVRGIELDDENTQNRCFRVSLDINIPDLLA